MSADTAAGILDELMRLAGEQPAGRRATFGGADPVLPTPFRIGDLGAAVIAAGAVQSARLFEQRTGMVQTVGVDVDAAAVEKALGVRTLNLGTQLLHLFLVVRFRNHEARDDSSRGG